MIQLVWTSVFRWVTVAAVVSLPAGQVVSQLRDNDSLQLRLADPTIFSDKGTYYLYGTGGGQYSNGFAVFSSPDLKTWKGPTGARSGYALAKGDAFGTDKFWAPQVFRYRNKYYMAYAASEHIGIAESDHPEGPFASKTAKPISEETKQIDPFVFADDNGKLYLYYVVVANGGNRIYVAEMQDNFSTINWSTAKLCIEATEPWENTEKKPWTVTEGPTVVKQRGLYYLLYSANDFRSVDYAVGYATSESPFGPWKKHAGNPILHKSITGENGSGHGDLVKGKKGEWLYVFHTHHSAQKVAPRKTAIIKMAFKKDKSTGKDVLVAQPSTFRYLLRQ